MTRFPAYSCAFLYALLCALGFSGPLWAQDSDRIWGRVHTKSGEVHEGFLRWARNEVSWVDILGGSKDVPPENYLAWLASRESEGPPVRTIDLLGFRITWDEADPDFPATSRSGIRFGHVSSLRVIGRDRVELTLRSGELLELGGRAVRRTVREVTIEAPGRRPLELEWRDLDRVLFSAVPAGARAPSRRLHGTVEDRQGNRYTGYVSWDRDEIFESDVLDGEDMQGGGDREISFGQIVSIARIPGGSRVVLVNGIERDLTGTRDVDRRNRGIGISDPGLGMVEVEWSEFRILRLHEPVASFGYDTFDGGRLLVGTLVTQSGEEVDGVIRWDADEAASWEMLNGRADGVEFTIEFGKVSRIVREGAFGATVTLLDGRTFELGGRTFERNGRTFPLGDSNDVDWDNKGILIQPEVADGDSQADSSRWRVIPWDDFREVRFRPDTTAQSGGLE